MCLFTNRKTPYIAKEDIIIYKVVCTNSNGIYESFYARFPYKLGVEYEQHEDFTIEEVPFLYYGTKYIISKGWFHSYIDYFHTFMEYNSIIKDVVIVKGIIPKGSEYYRGVGGEICSRKIKLIEEIKLTDEMDL